MKKLISIVAGALLSLCTHAQDTILRADTSQPFAQLPLQSVQLGGVYSYRVMVFQNQLKAQLTTNQVCVIQLAPSLNSTAWAVYTNDVVSTTGSWFHVTVGPILYPITNGVLQIYTKPSTASPTKYPLAYGPLEVINTTGYGAISQANVTLDFNWDWINSTGTNQPVFASTLNATGAVWMTQWLGMAMSQGSNAFDAIGSAAAVSNGLSGQISIITNTTITLNGVTGTLNSNLTFSIAVNSAGIAGYATNAQTVVGVQSQLLATAVQPAALAGYVATIDPAYLAALTNLVGIGCTVAQTGRVVYVTVPVGTSTATVNQIIANWATTGSVANATASSKVGNATNWVEVDSNGVWSVTVVTVLSTVGDMHVVSTSGGGYNGPNPANPSDSIFTQNGSWPVTPHWNNSFDNNWSIVYAAGTVYVDDNHSLAYWGSAIPFPTTQLPLGGGASGTMVLDLIYTTTYVTNRVCVATTNDLSAYVGTNNVRYLSALTNASVFDPTGMADRVQALLPAIATTATNGYVAATNAQAISAIALTSDVARVNVAMTNGQAGINVAATNLTAYINTGDSVSKTNYQAELYASNSIATTGLVAYINAGDTVSKTNLLATIYAATQGLVTASVTNGLAGPSITNGLVSAVSLASITNAAIIDATNRVAIADYAQDTAMLLAATNAIYAVMMTNNSFQINGVVVGSGSNVTVTGGGSTPGAITNNQANANVGTNFQINGMVVATGNVVIAFRSNLFVTLSSGTNFVDIVDSPSISNLQIRLTADEALLDMNTFYDSMQQALGGGSAWGQFWDGFATTNYISGGSNYIWSLGNVAVGSQAASGALWVAMCSDSNASTTVTELVKGSNMIAGANTSLMSYPGKYGSNCFNFATTYGATSAWCPVPNGADFSLSLWVREAVTNENDHPYCSFGQGIADRQITAVVSPGNGFVTLQVAHYSDDYTYASIQLVTQLWYHIVVTEAIASKSETVYVNGANAGSRTLGGTLNISGTACLGGWVQATANHPNAAVQQVAIWNHVLSQSEVTSLYNSGGGQANPLAITSAAGTMTSTVISVTNFVPNNFRTGILLNDPTKTLNPNTDLIMYMSRDSGATYTPANLSDMGTIAGVSSTNRYWLSNPQPFVGGSVASNIQIKTFVQTNKNANIKAIIGNAQP